MNRHTAPSGNRPLWTGRVKQSAAAASALTLALIAVSGCGGSSDSSATTASADTTIETATTVGAATTAPATAATDASATDAPVTDAPTTAAPATAAPTTAAPVATTAPRPTIEETRAAIAAYRQCLTENGLDLSDPDSVNSEAMNDPTSEEFAKASAALDTCEPLSDGTDITLAMTEEQKTSLTGWYAALQGCAEAKGEPGPDPQASAEDLANYDFQAFTKVLEECRAEVPLPADLADFTDLIMGQ